MNDGFETQSLTFDLSDLLAFYADAGVDTFLEEAPINRFEQAAQSRVATPKASQPKLSTRRQQPASTQPNSSAKTPQRTVPDEATLQRALEIAKSCDDLDTLKEAIAGFDGCNLKHTARSTVFADGNPDADLMVIGEAPGREEDAQGLPFVGPAGQLFDKMLASIGLDRTTTYLTTALPWRPPGNRTPTPSENALCKPFVDRHIMLVQPKKILLLGAGAGKVLLSTQDNIMNLRGRWTTLTVAESSFDVMVSLHPSYLLKHPPQKALAWQDLQALQTALKLAP